MSAFDEQKCQEMSQSISAIYDHADASLPEILASTGLSLKIVLENEPDKMLRAFFLVNLIKHLTMDHKKEPVVDLLRPNGNG